MKSLMAYNFTCDKLWDKYSDALYFWTFTFVDTMPDWYYSRCWSRFIADLQNHYGGQVKGVKVIEAHVTHGLHYHCIINKRLSVHLVRRIGKKYGLGRNHVCKVKSATIFDYLAKYLQKDIGELHDNVAKWGTIGTFKGVKVKDVVVESNLTKNYQAIKPIVGQLKYWEFQLLKEYTRQYGVVPVDIIRQTIQTIFTAQEHQASRFAKEQPF